MWSSGSKSSTWAATCERNGDGSKRSIRLIGERPARSPAQNASTPEPIAVTSPSPVIHTRRRVDPPVGHGEVRPGGRTGLVDGDVAPATASAIVRNDASVRPAIGRVKKPVDDRRNVVAERWATNGRPTRRRKSCSIETRQPSPDGSIRQVTSIPAVAPATWTNRSRQALGFGPRPRPPDDRQRQPEERHERATGDESTTTDRSPRGRPP